MAPVCKITSKSVKISGLDVNLDTTRQSLVTFLCFTRHGFMHSIFSGLRSHAQNETMQTITTIFSF
jgi:hypothetical protein